MKAFAKGLDWEDKGPDLAMIMPSRKPFFFYKKKKIEAQFICLQVERDVGVLINVGKRGNDLLGGWFGSTGIFENGNC